MIHSTAARHLRSWSGSCATDKDATDGREKRFASFACGSSANSWIFLNCSGASARPIGRHTRARCIRKARPPKWRARFSKTEMSGRPDLRVDHTAFGLAVDDDAAGLLLPAADARGSDIRPAHP